MTIGGEVTPYSTLSIPLGSVHSAKSSQVSTDCQLSSSSSSFNIIFNSGCTRHMFLHRESFLTYKSTPKSYVILADKSKVPCLGSGTVIFTLLDKNIILHDDVHVPKLWSPLLSVCCFRHLIGCSLIADNDGSFLTFPKFILQVDNSSDCTISGTFCTNHDTIHFDSRIVGLVSNVSENTRFWHQRRPAFQQKTSSINNNIQNL
jgi:hypothetical protein